ncbi:hypothetical protein BAE44_0010936 [Dichanthelium oligosanthes]|uniref:Uncharacterized protein n=1 Tax=Dichanthelium oligosanthes TaxID=888268 RepID=A0A1E5VSJ2_9POAL|nr:hypothetical protein BAE44_0010936 [Dichanthelium oligosanthes]
MTDESHHTPHKKYMVTSVIIHSEQSPAFHPTQVLHASSSRPVQQNPITPSLPPLDTPSPRQVRLFYHI